CKLGPTTHSSDVAKGLAKFIYAVGTKVKFDFGSYIFYETLEHAVSYALQLPIAFPTLLYSIILEQHPDILGNADTPCRRKGKLSIDQRLLSRTHAADSVGPSVQKQVGALTRKQMIADLTET
ncbi:envelope-like protein, partial [Trifolium medium]|nr:envelope-like protein [Trifolium medium]